MKFILFGLVFVGLKSNCQTSTHNYSLSFTEGLQHLFYQSKIVALDPINELTFFEPYRRLTFTKQLKNGCQLNLTAFKYNYTFGTYIPIGGIYQGPGSNTVLWTNQIGLSITYGIPLIAKKAYNFRFKLGIYTSQDLLDPSIFGNWESSTIKQRTLITLNNSDTIGKIVGYSTNGWNWTYGFNVGIEPTVKISKRYSVVGNFQMDISPRTIFEEHLIGYANQYPIDIYNHSNGSFASASIGLSYSWQHQKKIKKPPLH